MKQRVNIARAAALDPQVLLMDEPFGSLDAQTREDLQLELLAIFGKAHSTVFFVTHDITEAIFMSDLVAVLTSRPGTVRELLKIDLPRPRSPRLRSTPEFAGYHQRLWELLHRREDAST